MSVGEYDIIGDIHGHAEVLRRLLRKMDYQDDNGVFRHPQRRAIFFGDFVDRGPEQREVVRMRKPCVMQVVRSSLWEIMNSTLSAGPNRTAPEVFSDVTATKTGSSTKNF